MWKVLVIFNLLALCCAVSSSPPSPISAVFTSVNLRNVLQWVPGNGTEGDTHFTVQYAIYGDSVPGSKGRRVHWREVQRCTDTAQSWCDLSNETRDLEQGYYGRIRAVSRRASSKWVLTQRFDPKSDTSFGPPLVSVDIENNSAIIKLKGPMRYQPDNHTPVVSMAKLYPQMMYNLSIRNSHRTKPSHITVLSELYKQRLTEYNTEYCFSAKAKFLSMPVECQASEWHCVTTPPDPAIDQLKRVVVGIVVPFAFMCMLVVIGYILYQYLMGKGQKTPYMLEQPTFHQTLLTFPPEKTNLLVITVIKPVCPIQDQHITDPPPGYGIHGFGSPQEPVQPGDDESIDYGFVAVAPDIIVKKEDDREGKYENREEGQYLKCEHRENRSGDSPVEKEWGAENSQPSSYLSQSSIHVRLQKTPVTHTMTEVGSLVLAQPWFQNPDQLTQNQGLFLQGETTTEKEGSKFLGLFSNTTPQTGPFHIPLNLQNKMGEGLQDEMPVVDEKIDGGVEEVDKRETAPLLSPYATQNINNTFASHTDQSDFIADNEYKEGTIFICMDPKTGKLVLPELEMLVTRENGLGKCGEHKDGGEEEVDAARGKLLLEDVFIRQASEEDRGWEADDILTKWNLVIPIEE